MTARFFVSAAILLLSTACGSARAPLPKAPADTDPNQTHAAEQAFKKGRESASHGDSVRAEQYLQLALDKGYDRRRALPVLLNVCLSSGRLRAALNDAEPELRERPDDLELRYLVAAIHLGLGQREEAQAELGQLLRVDPRDPAALFLLGVIESDDLGDDGAARSHFGDYLAVAPNGKHAAEVRDRLSLMGARGVARSEIEPAQATENRMPRYEPDAVGVPVERSAAAPQMPTSDTESGWR